jgi:cytochrome b6-f complex iron-sulfur subunit
VSGNVITIELAQQPGLAANNGSLLILAQRVFVINTNSTFRAFTSICTHEQCDVNSFSNGTINCPCHGSQYNTSGQPVAGPAPAPLTEFAASFSATNNRLTITKG